MLASWVRLVFRLHPVGIRQRLVPAAFSASRLTYLLSPWFCFRWRGSFRAMPCEVYAPASESAGRRSCSGCSWPRPSACGEAEAPPCWRTMFRAPTWTSSIPALSLPRSAAAASGCTSRSPAAVALLFSCMALGSRRRPRRIALPNSPQLVLCQLQRRGARVAARNRFLPVSASTRPSRAGRLAGIAGILLSTFYAARTGSRGCVIAAIRHADLDLLAEPEQVEGGGSRTNRSRHGAGSLHRRRILQHAASPVSAHQRCRRPVKLNRTWRASLPNSSGKKCSKPACDTPCSHPLFGVGPDQFAAAVSQEAAGDGQQVPWLGTHNTYTQVSSECGIPALIFYVAVIGALPAFQPSALSADSRHPRRIAIGRPQPLSAGRHFGLCRQRFFLPHGLQPLPAVPGRVHRGASVRRAPAYTILELTELTLTAQGRG